jgi:hypothetical protein
VRSNERSACSLGFKPSLSNALIFARPQKAPSKPVAGSL